MKRCEMCGAEMKKVGEDYECLLCGHTTKDTSDNENPTYIG